MCGTAVPSRKRTTGDRSAALRKFASRCRVIGIGLLPHARGFRVFDLFQGPRGGVQAPPGVATGGKPCPPVADVLQASGGQQAALQLVAVGGALGFIDDPVRARQDARRRAPQPRVVPREPIMLAQHPENPAVMLVVAARFEAAGAVKDALLGREIPGQRHRALVMQPGVQALLRLLVVAPAVEVHHHHARFVAVGAVARKSPRAQSAARRCRDRPHS